MMKYGVAGVMNDEEYAKGARVWYESEIGLTKQNIRPTLAEPGSAASTVAHLTLAGHDRVEGRSPLSAICILPKALMYT